MAIHIKYNNSLECFVRSVRDCADWARRNPDKLHFKLPGNENGENEQPYPGNLRPGCYLPAEVAELLQIIADLSEE